MYDKTARPETPIERLYRFIDTRADVRPSIRGMVADAIEHARGEERHRLCRAIRGLAVLNQEDDNEMFYLGLREAAAFLEHADDEEIAAALSSAPEEERHDDGTS